jgi:hypothetical protein
MTEFAKNLPDRPLGEARFGFLLHYEPLRDGIRIVSERGPETAEAFSEWAFGAGDQAVTLVARTPRGVSVEHRISYYSRPGKFDLTLGHQPGISRSASSALGITQPAQTLRECFGCHSSASEDLQQVSPGVGCIRCHPGAIAHVGGGGAAGNPLRMAAKDQVAVCAECHRLTTPTGNENDPLNIRFQPLRLIKSRCYQEGDLGCVHCHPGHRNAVREDPTYYREKCLGCHAGQGAKGDCVSCHMPKSSPAPYLTFVDHYIR